MANLLSIINLNQYFSDITKKIPHCQENTKSYIADVFANQQVSINQSITLIYAEANYNYNFEKFQTVGDWLLFAKSIFPESLNGASSEYYDVIAQCAYYRCYRMLNKQWPLFEELADMFPILVKNLQKLLRSSDASDSLF